MTNNNTIIYSTKAFHSAQYWTTKLQECKLTTPHTPHCL